jgi:exodeoxyribonuclease V alpha subunit
MRYSPAAGRTRAALRRSLDWIKGKNPSAPGGAGGVGTARSVRIFKTYGADAIQVMTENPYRLAREIRGIGFKTADAIAMKLGIEKTALIRVRAGISYALTDAMDEGHCGLPTDELVPLAEKLLEVPQQLIRTALELELQEGTVIADRVGETPCVFLAGLHRAERTIADRMTRLAKGALPWPWIDPDKALPWVEKHIGLALAESQVAAIRLALTSKVLVMTGGPGVGKTTIVRAILRILAAKGTELLLCAPTGRAAKRMTEATGFEAKTIHRLLEVDPKGGGFKRGEDNPLDCDLLVVDETRLSRSSSSASGPITRSLRGSPSVRLSVCLTAARRPSYWRAANAPA